MDEYKALLDIVNAFDDRLLVIKGWAITFSLATLILAVQKRSGALLAVVTLSAVCFWVLEAEFKLHQSKYYARMRAIEIIEAKLEPIPGRKGCYVLPKTKGDYITTQLIDYTWWHPGQAITNEVCTYTPPTRWTVYFYRHIYVPHLLIALFCLAYFMLSPRQDKPARARLLLRRWVTR